MTKEELQYKLMQSALSTKHCNLMSLPMEDLALYYFNLFYFWFILGHFGLCKVFWMINWRNQHNGDMYQWKWQLKMHKPMAVTFYHVVAFMWFSEVSWELLAYCNTRCSSYILQVNKNITRSKSKQTLSKNYQT